MPHIHEKVDFVVGAIIVRGNKVLMINHKKLDMWLFPGGHIEPDEDPVEAIHREVLEETGCEIELLGETPPFSDEDSKSLTQPRFMNIHRINDNGLKDHKHVAINFLAILKCGEPKLNIDEHKGIGWFSAEDIDVLPTRKNIRYYAKTAISEVAMINFFRKV